MFLFNKLIPKFAEGGYTTPGDPSQPAGIVHRGEWIAPKHMVDNPATGSVIAALENVRSNRVSLNPALTSGKLPFATGGYVSGSSVPSVPGVPPVPGQTSTTDATNLALVEAINRLLAWKPKVYTEMIKKDLDTLNNIDKNRNL